MLLLLKSTLSFQSTKIVVYLLFLARPVADRRQIPPGALGWDPKRTKNQQEDYHSHRNKKHDFLVISPTQKLIFTLCT